MPALRFTFNIDGKKQFDRIFKDVANLLADFTPVFNEVAEEFYKEEKQIFERKGDLGRGEGGKWADLSDKYKKWKERKHPGKKILELTGKLKKSLTEKNAEGNVNKITPFSMEIGSDLKTKKTKQGVEYCLARLHQNGTFKMPKRPVMRLNKTIKNAITKKLRVALYGK